MRRRILLLTNLVILSGYSIFFIKSEIDSDFTIRVNQEKIKLAERAVERYNRTKKIGTQIQVYYKAVAAAKAYYQAQDYGNYTKWKAIEKREAIKAKLEF